jgi:hypothetical protein
MAFPGSTDTPAEESASEQTFSFGESETAATGETEAAAEEAPVAEAPATETSPEEAPAEKVEEKPAYQAPAFTFDTALSKEGLAAANSEAAAAEQPAAPAAEGDVTWDDNWFKENAAEGGAENGTNGEGVVAENESEPANTTTAGGSGFEWKLD